MKRFFHILNFLLLGFFGFTLWSTLQFNTSDDFNHTIPKNYKGFGIDVSHHQGKVDWNILFSQTLVPQIQFVYIKATEGKDHVDRKWTYNRTALIEKNIK